MLFKPSRHLKPGRAWDRLGLTTAIAICCAATAPATGQPTATALQSTGDPGNRVDMVFIGDGYTADEISTTYVSHINGVLDHFFDPEGVNTGVVNPYARYRNFFNIYRVDLESNQSGVTRIGPNNEIIEFVDTALASQLGLTSGGGYYPQYLQPSFTAYTMIDQGVATLGLTYEETDWQYTAVNTTYYGGGDYNAAFSAGHASAAELALHEGGHWNHDLADEYGGLPQPYAGPTSYPNLDTDPNAGDWAHWLGFNDPQTGFVDAYLGGGGYDTGVYHPSPDSKMRVLNEAFDPIAREKIILDIYDRVDPIDAKLATGPTYGLFDDLWISVIDPDVIKVQWKLNGELIAGQTDQTLDLSALALLLSPGNHTVTARAYDEIVEHAFSDNNDPDYLDLVRKDLGKLEQSVSFNIDIDWLRGDVDLDGDVDQQDLDTVLLAFGTGVGVGETQAGDFNGDGQVGIAELDAVLANWTSASPAVVPEPIAAPPLLALTLLCRRRRTAHRSRA